MNKKGQTNLQIGLIVATFITVLVGVILFQSISQQVGEATTTWDIVNVSISASAQNDTAYYFTDYRALSSVVIMNGTVAGSGNEVISSGNYTVTDNVIDPTTGGLAVSITPSGSEYDTKAWFISSATAEPTTYVNNSGARAVTGLIAIFFALAIIVVTLEPTLRSNVLGALGR